MGSPVVVNVFPLRDDLPGFSEAPEQLTREAFIAEPAVETLHETVLAFWVVFSTCLVPAWWIQP